LKKEPNVSCAVEDMVLRERLAAERTHLANERTLLAYARTSLAFLVSGVSGVHLLGTGFFRAIAWIFVALGPVLLAVGTWRFMRFRRALRGPSSHRP
jgi:putative membrane protein